MASIHPLPDVIKGKCDPREYRAFSLAQNGVKCLVVKDTTSKTTGVACAVKVGAGADPIPGLAHLVEHMCFLGSAKYPRENAYKQYLSQHGGRSNASTSLYFTTYRFEVLAAHAERAIDMFGQFFVAPLFLPDSTLREVQAVDSENSKNLVSDGRRRLQALKTLADPSHYYSKFTTGNCATLQDGNDHTRQAMLAFHQHHYTPDRMTVVVMGPQDLDTLQEWTTRQFGSIPKQRPVPGGVSAQVQELVADAAKTMPPSAPNHQTTTTTSTKTSPPTYNSAFVGNNHYPVLLTLQPIRSSLRTLSLNFPMPPTQHMPNSSPTRLLGHLLGHEGTGSAFAQLQSAGLIISLSAGARIVAPDQTLFQIELQLTKEGEEQWDTLVVPTLFGHMRLIQDVVNRAMNGNKEAVTTMSRLWQEMRMLSEMMFHYPRSRSGSVYSLAPSLAQSLSVYGSELCKSAGSLLQEELPEPKVLHEFCSKLTPTNCILERLSTNAWEEARQKDTSRTVNADGFGEQTEPWYGFKFYKHPIEKTIQQGWRSASLEATELISQLHLPAVNPYIPRTLDLCPDLPEEAKMGPRINEKEMDPPNLIVQSQHGRLWHRLEDRYALPQSSLTFLIRTPLAQHSQCTSGVDGDGKEGTWRLSAKQSMHSRLLTSLFSQAMAQETYDADLAGLQWSLSSGLSGIKLTCSGYSDRLSDLALFLLKTFRSGSFLHDSSSLFVAVHDRTVQNLDSYLESKRADTYALYYRNLLLSTTESDVETSLEAVRSIDLESLRQHHTELLGDDKLFVECLYAGNVAKSDAMRFYEQATQMLPATKSTIEERTASWMPGPDERRLENGQDLMLHFTSQNPAEENGAVLMTYQSQIPGFKGDELSSSDSLHSSACIRLLCHMLREPLFNELRTQQQLGYIVQSYYDLGFASGPHGTKEPQVTPVDFITINILSKKVSPAEVRARVDDFLVGFRNILETMPSSEIQDHADALSEKMLKPVQNLSSETSRQFGKIRRYSPELFVGNKLDDHMPWNSVKSLAGAIASSNRNDLLATWDRMVLDPRQRSRVVSMVYGKNYPFDASCLQSGTGVVANDVPNLVALRKMLKPYDGVVVRQSTVITRIRSLAALRATPTTMAATAVVGIGVAAGIALAQSKRR